ncbi:MAG: methylcrotonoyl-CoA carboxylase, partial [Rhodospirillaceae bacterium]|nr:methylcrotonoyl-CoA carboxylase [Rhodospirillaceae bacterium]
MTAWTTRIDVRSKEFVANAEHYRGLVTDLREQVSAVKLGGGERARERHLARGKLLPRERVRTLLDPGTPWLEF